MFVIRTLATCLMMSKQTSSKSPQIGAFTQRWHSHSYPSIDPARPELTAEGRNIVVTGGGTGIGRAMSLAFATAGASSITLIGRRHEALKSTAQEIRLRFPSVRIICETADVVEREQVEVALDKVVTRVGRLSVLCCNAGVVPYPEHVLDMTPEQLRHGFDVNVWGAINVVQCFHSRATRGGLIINTASGLAHIVPMAKMAAYTSSKVANLKIMEHLASENPDLHIVNMHPGVVATKLQGQRGENHHDNGMIFDERKCPLPAPFHRLFLSFTI